MYAKDNVISFFEKSQQMGNILVYYKKIFSLTKNIYV